MAAISAFDVGRRRCTISTPTSRASPSATRTASRHELVCDFIAGCDGFHGPSRQAIPRRRDHRASAHLSVRLARHPRRGAASSPRADLFATTTRLRACSARARRRCSAYYVQCDPHDELDAWPDDRIWHELQRAFRHSDGWTLVEGPIFQKGIDRACAAMSASRCNMAGCSSPATPRISCRRPAPKASTSPSPTCWCSRGARCLVQEARPHRARLLQRQCPARGFGNASASPGT